MALARQTLPVPFAQGLDTKSDPKQLAIGKLVTLENASFTSLRRLKKRNGYAALSQNILGGGTIAAGAGLLTNGSELLLANGVNLYSWDANGSAWFPAGAFQSVTVSEFPVIRNSYQQTAPDMAWDSASNLSCFVWEDTNPATCSIRYSIVDRATGRAIVTAQPLDSAAPVATQPRVLAFNATYFVILYTEAATSTLWMRAVPIATPTTINARVALTNTLAGSLNYDACIAPGTIRLFYAWDSSAPNVSVAYRNSDLSAGPAATSMATNANRGLTIFQDAFNQNLVVCGISSANAVQFGTWNQSGTNLSGPTTIETLAGANGSTITGVSTSASATALQVFYTSTSTGSDPTYAATNSYAAQVRSVAITGVGYTPGTPTTLLRGVGLGSKAALGGPGGTIPFMIVAFQTPAQATYFMVDTSGRALAKLLYEDGGGLPTRNSLPNPVGGPLSPQVALLVKDLLTVQAGTVYAQTGVVAMTINFADAQNAYLRAYIGGALHIGGGFLTEYDGVSPVELGFHLFPENLASAQFPLGGGLGNQNPMGPNTTYSVPTSSSYGTSGTYEWMDNSGNIHRSAPSIPTVQKLSGMRSLVASTTVGGANVTVNSGAAEYLIPGMVLNGPGWPNAGAQSALIQGWIGQPATGVTVTPTAGSTNTGQNYTAPYQYRVADQNGQVTFTAGDTTITLPSIQYLYIFGQTTNGSPTITVGSTQGLRIGQIVYSPGGRFANGSTITAINAATSTITISNNATSTTTSPAAIQVSYSAAATTAIGSPTVTVAAAVATYAGNYIGAVISDGVANIPSGATILSVGATTITMSANATATGATTAFVYFPGTAQLMVGQTIASDIVASIVGGTKISAISTTGGVSTITIDTPAAQNSGTATTGALYFANTYALKVTLPTLRLTAKQAPRSPAQLLTYQTLANGTVYYRSSNPTLPTLNDPTIDSLVIWDTLSDAQLQGNPQIYTTGGVVEDIPPGPVSSLVISHLRLWAIDSGNPYLLWYSKQIGAAAPVEFSDLLTFNLDPRGGSAVALADMDEKTIVFKQRGLSFIAGQGPDATGGQNDFIEVPIKSDVGCISPRSIVSIPDGLIFQSAKGFYLLNRGLQVSYIGMDVESYNSQTVTSAQLIPQTTTVRLTLGNGQALVYDYLIGQWSTFTNLAAVDSTLWNGLFLYLTSGGLVLQETPGTFSDNGAYIALRAKTGWISFAGLQGFARLQKVLLLGDYVSAHNLQIVIASSVDNFDTPTTQTNTIAASSPEQWQVSLAQQKCQAVQLTLTEQQSGGTIGEGLSISGLIFDIAVKGGPVRVPAARSYG